MTEPLSRTTRLLCLAALLLMGLSAPACEEATGPTLWAEDPPQPAERRVVELVTTGVTQCALTETGHLYCWGENRFGEFGNGTRESSPASVLAAGGLQFNRVFGGESRVCGLDAVDRAWCWGHNLNGEVGDGTTEDRWSPVPVAGEHHFRTITSRTHTCGVTESGQALCWGSALGGQLGTGQLWDGSTVPVAVATSAAYTAVTAGTQFTCALRSSGEAECWGWGAGLGSGPIDRSVAYPTPVSGGARYTHLSAGAEWVCGLDLRGAPVCWGKTGALFSDEFRATPEPIQTPLRFREIVSGAAFGACALTMEGQAYGWRGREPPLLVPGNHRWAGLSAGAIDHSGCGRTPGGSAYCWRWALSGGVWRLTVPEPIPTLPA